MPKALIRDGRPTFSNWIGTGANTETEDYQLADFGTVAASSNSTEKYLSLEFNADFGGSSDAVYEDIRVWLANSPERTNSGLYIQGNTVKATPGTVTLPSGTLIGTNPFNAKKLAAGTYYQSGDKAIRYLQMQLQNGVSTAYNLSNEYRENPVIMVDFQRRDSAVSKLNTYDILNDARGFGHLFTYSDVALYAALDSNRAVWQYVSGIKDNSFSINQGQERVSWTTGKPDVTFHELISSVVTEAKFKLDSISPAWRAIAFNTTATENATDNTIDWEQSGIARPPVYYKYALEWRTMGGFRVWLEMPKGSLTPAGEEAPGGDDFAGLDFMIKGLAYGVNKTVSKMRVSRTPMERAAIETTWVLS